MVEIEIDSKSVEVQQGSMVMDAAKKLGTHIPHFCYHKKLSIAANCRMCLVEVEKAPKPLPACATPVTPGMKVHTHSEKAVQAQKSVMEFLLINHPLDCPICDQGGECQLQDLAVGYGKTESRYSEEKRVVFHKNVGPLISMEEMSRCIHCTRCVRFGQEIAGVMELGMLNRGEHSEITSFVGKSVDSELSGNMIDLCPVGALTSKPFRYSARTWELGRRRSVSPHDSLGSNVVLQTKANQVLRTVPLENEAINECWISDKDRFAYEGLNSADRLKVPMVKQDNRWVQTDWETALNYIARSLNSIKADHGANSIAALAHPMASVEELYLLQKVIRGLGSGQVETRLRQQDISGAAKAPWLGMKVAELSQLQRAFFIGSFLRKDQPLLAARVRAATKRGLKVTRLGASSEDWLMPIAANALATPSNWPAELAGVAAAVAQAKGVAAPSNAQISAQAQAVADSLMTGERKAVFLGAAAMAHPQFAQLHAYAQFIATQTGATLGFLPEGGNTVGAHLVHAVSETGVQGILAQAPKAVVLLQVEPSADLIDPQAAKAALAQAGTVIAMTAFDSPELREVADVLLPVTPYSETSGSYVNAEGTLQSVQAAVRPLGEARPAWKVLRVLGNVLGLDNYYFNTSEEVLAEALPTSFEAQLNNQTSATPAVTSLFTPAVERLADVTIHSTDAIVRRAPALQLTQDAKRAVKLGLPSSLFAQLGLKEGDAVKVSQQGASVVMPATEEKSLIDGVVRLSAGTAVSAQLGTMFGQLSVERV
ncbi:MAG: NADH-quinone oxidoreductase subunit G [Polynucleobacter sp.]|nr:MAG: NADH-quinone oxidoreductase subunit G [Polynucleobacter sp.]